jgi:flagellar hook-associated protein 2
VLNKINSAGLNLQASIINDGSGSRPYRLVITSTVSGTVGQMAFSTVGSGLAFETLTEAQDARVVMGNIDSPNSIVVSSSSNRITGVVQGLTLNLTAASDSPIQVSVSQSIDSLVNELNSFVTAYNATLDRMAELTRFVPDTNQKGVLLGDSAVRQIQERLYRQLSRALPADYSLRRLSSVGVSFGSGGRLTLNETAFRDAIEADPDGVKNLFTKVAITTDAAGTEKPQYVGIAASLKEELRNITNSTNGLLGRQTSRLDERLGLYNRQIENLGRMLEQKEKRYYTQFQAMEKALAQMQSQQSALDALANLSASFGSRNK